MEKRQKIVKKDRKIALLNLYLLYLYHVWNSSGATPPSSPDAHDYVCC